MNMEADDGPALFGPVDPRAGQAERVMAEQIEAWQRAGRAVSLVTRRMLLDQAAAVDMARASRRATAVSGASRVLLELLVGFRLVDDSPPPVGDPFERFLASVEGTDDTGTG
jgi:hypothetical protein